MNVDTNNNKHCIHTSYWCCFFNLLFSYDRNTFLTVFLVSTLGVSDQIVSLHYLCSCSSLVSHVMKYFFVHFYFFSVALGLVFSLLCPDPPRSWMRSLLCLAIAGLDSVLVSHGVFWTTSLLQGEPNWNSSAFGTTEREWESDTRMMCFHWNCFRCVKWQLFASPLTQCR